jgi:hypothetical protein
MLLVEAACLAYEDPYRMEIMPLQGHANVQFFQPSRHDASAVFEVEYPFRNSHMITLDSPYVVIPGRMI